MNDMIVFGCLFAVVSFCLITFFFYNTYRGVHDSLANASTGSVYNFRYFQPLSGDYERYLAKVMNVRKLSQSEISRLNWSSDYRRYDKDFQRSPTLVTCEMSNGDIRQFYAERSDMCKRTAVGNLLFKMGVAHLF
ncbi:MAG: hypothetical protein EBZ87_03155 [Microbacteriaceae bacterium]|nr:hypothetical protein [Microbacteriaceae bacterium]